MKTIVNLVSKFVRSLFVAHASAGTIALQPQAVAPIGARKKKRGAKRKYDYDMILSLHSEGLSKYRIAQRMKCSEGVVGYAIKTYGGGVETTH